MGRPALLSLQILKLRSLSFSGVPASSLLSDFITASHRFPYDASLKPLIRSTKVALELLVETGSSVGKVLEPAQILARNFERHLLRLEAVKRQFAFQGAVAFVIPWGVVFLIGRPSLNPSLVLGAVVQVFGLSVFSVMVKSLLKNKITERSQILDFLPLVLMRVLAGDQFITAISSSLDVITDLRLKNHWEGWFIKQQLKAKSWPVKKPEFELSELLQECFSEFLSAGARVNDYLEMELKILIEDWGNEVDEKITGLPNKISLLFCVLLVPAFFLIILGGLWHEISPLMK